MRVFDQVFVNTISFKQVIREGKSVPTFAYYQNKGKVKLSGQACSKAYYQGRYALRIALVKLVVWYYTSNVFIDSLISLPKGVSFVSHEKPKYNNYQDTTTFNIIHLNLKNSPTH